MKITAFALFCVLFNSFGHYSSPTEEIQPPARAAFHALTPRYVSSPTETENMDDEYQPKLTVAQSDVTIRPGFARRDRHRAIRSKSGHATGPAHSGLSATIPGRVYPLAESQPMLVFFTNIIDIPFVGKEHQQRQEQEHQQTPSPRPVSSQTETETTLTDSVATDICPQPMLVFFTNMIDAPFVGEEHQQRQEQEHQQTPSPRSVSSQTEIQTQTLTDSVAAEICLSAEEKKLYDLIMAYRKSKRLPPIPYSAKLSKVAQTHVRDLETNYDYENASTCNPHSWSTKGTWTSCCYTSDHKQASCMWTKPKEIAGYEGYGYEIAYYSSAGANATEGLEGWKKSPGHNPLIINSGTWSKVKWQAIGIGIYGQYGVVWFGEEADESEMKVCK